MAQPSAMQGNSRRSSLPATAWRAVNQLPAEATKSSSTSSGMIRAMGRLLTSSGPATNAVPKPAMPNTT